MKKYKSEKPNPNTNFFSAYFAGEFLVGILFLLVALLFGMHFNMLETVVVVISFFYCYAFGNLFSLQITKSFNRLFQKQKRVKRILLCKDVSI